MQLKVKSLFEEKINQDEDGKSDRIRLRSTKTCGEIKSLLGDLEFNI